MRTRFALPIAGAALVLAACSGADDGTDGIDLGASDQSDDTTADVETDDDTDAATDPDDDDDAASASATDDDAAEPDADQDTATTSGDPAADGLVDMTEAIAGTWPVGDAGTVTFSIADGALVLDDVTASDGWRADIDEQDPDEIEVDFRQANVEWEIEIELEDGGAILEIEIDQDIEDAATGS